MYTMVVALAPWVAAGTAAVAGPLLIHLLYRKRYQVVPWAAIRFLVVAERRHKRRIDQWLLLLLRVFALLLVLFAMLATNRAAEELWQRVTPGATETVANVPRTHHVIVLDASLSMTARTDGDQTRFQRALTQAEALVHAGRDGDGYTVLVLGAAQPLVPGPANDRDKVVAEIRKAKPTHGAGDHAAVLTSVADILAHSPRAYPRRQLTIFTDLQKSSWGNAVPRAESGTAEAWPRVTARADAVIVDCAGRDAENLAVAEVALADPMPLVDQPVSVTVSVANFGRAERKGVRVELLVGRPTGGAPVPVAQRELEPVVPGGRQSVRFDLDVPHRFRERGVHVLLARIVGGDDLPADDARAVAVEVRDGIHALLVDGRADPDPKRRAATLLNFALFPPQAKYTDTPNRPRVVTPAEFTDPAADHLAGTDCVFLCDVPGPTPDMAAKLDAVLRRGGTVVFGLGPNAARDRAQYNAVFHRGGEGVLPGALVETVAVSGPDDPGFRLAAEDEAYRRPPLLMFGAPELRSELINEPFRSYVRIEAPADGDPNRLLTFSRAGSAPLAPGASAAKPDPALVEWKKHRGRVYVFASTFNRDWTDWPAMQTYLVFWHEFLKYCVANPDRHTLRVGDGIEEFFPASAAGLTTRLTGPDGLSASVPLVMQGEAGVARFADTAVSGLYRIELSGAPDRVFAVNVPELVPGTPTESDLARVDPREFRSLAGLQFVTDAADAQPTSESGATVTTAPKPHGPRLARAAVLLAVLFLAAELVAAWRLGPSRTGGVGPPPARALPAKALALAGALLPLGVGALLLFAVLHADRTGSPLGFLPHNIRSTIEGAAGVPAAGPGEGTKWRFEGTTAFFKSPHADRRVVAGLAGLCLALTGAVYWCERRAAGGGGRVGVLAALRAVTFALAFYVLLAQLTLRFDREGWPEVVILLDTSASMAKVDELRDPAVRAKAAELVGAADLSHAHRLKLAQMLLTRKDADWLDRLLREKQVRVHVFAVDTQVRQVGTADEEGRLDEVREALVGLPPAGDGSHLGGGVEDVLKRFRGSTLAAVVMFTDGVTTAGDDLPKAARAAAVEGVPLYLVGTGDPWQTPDLALTDLQVEDVVGWGDQLVFKARLTARGEVPPAPVTVTLSEKLPNGKVVERGRSTVTPDLNGNPVDVSLAHAPQEVGEKTFILSVPAVPNETNRRNNEVQRAVLVTESRRVRVLYVEGYPRYDFRFVKVLLERESDKSTGGKSIEAQVVLLDASKGWAETDRSAFRGDFPTRTELFNFDVVILGDVDPKQVPRPAVALRDLADFVKEKGGGLLFLCGEHGTPAAFADTPLAEVLPVTPGDPPAATRPPEEQPLVEGYRPKWTPSGRQHPLFLLSPDEGASARQWGQFQELLWHAKGYRTKPAARVLATHPTLRAEGGPAAENHPLVVQHFVGNGPVLFFGFDDTWRWRFRNDEEHFDRFWMQAVRVLARSRVRRPEVRVQPKSEFRRDEKVTVEVRFPVEAPAPVGNNPVRVLMTRAPLANEDGAPRPGRAETTTLTLTRAPGPNVVFAATLARAPEGEYRFELVDPEVPGSRPSALARVLPPVDERERTELNRADLQAAASVSGGGFYTLANATDVFNDMKAAQRVTLNEPCPPVPLWNHPLLYALVLSLLLAEWLLRKRERLL
ncbi:VWA domain-containing protein [Gemmata algarum]|nr:VWA domain-containing protein [Gemmata algarum]